MTQEDLFDPKRARFNGPDYKPERDNVRLTGQIKRVYDVMKGGQWLNLAQISFSTGDPEASVSAQLRHLRKERFGSHTVERRHVNQGLFEYRVLTNPDASD